MEQNKELEDMTLKSEDKKVIKTLINIEITRENFKKDYSLRARIGIRILQLLQVLSIDYLESNKVNYK